MAVLLEWLPNLSSLCKLKIWDCPKLSSLLEGMDCLTALRELEILGCPELEKNCEQEWAKIVHVPLVKFIGKG